MNRMAVVALSFLMSGLFFTFMMNTKPIHIAAHIVQRFYLLPFVLFAFFAAKTSVSSVPPW